MTAPSHPRSTAAIRQAEAEALERIAQIAEATRNRLPEPTGSTDTLLAAVDLAVNQIRSSHASRDQRLDAMLAYGFWFGQQLVDHRGGQWRGLFEPVAPRVQVGRLVVSPVDAVARRLDSETEPTLSERWRQLPPTDASASNRERALDTNRDAWEQLSTDPAFTAQGPKLTRDQANAAIDPWIRSEGLEGQPLLVLAGGGGTHAPIYAAAGARVTVVDLSPAQLAIDRALASRDGWKVQTYEGSCDALDAFSDQHFCGVIQPVSTCYLPDLRQLFGEVHRVLRPGGFYVSQHKHPVALQALREANSDALQLQHPYVDGLSLTCRDDPSQVAHQSSAGEVSELPRNPLCESGTSEFIHTLESILGGICAAGLAIEAVSEPPRADAWDRVDSSAHCAWYLPPYLKVKARKPDVSG